MGVLQIQGKIIMSLDLKQRFFWLYWISKEEWDNTEKKGIVIIKGIVSFSVMALVWIVMKSIHL